jgi:type IV secretion system protein VirD4
MMLGINGENLADVERFLTATLADPTANLSMPAQWFFNFIPQRVFIDNALRALGHNGPTIQIGGVVLAPTFNPTPSLLNIVSAWGGNIKRSADHRQLTNIFMHADLTRDCLTINDKEKSVFMAQFAMYRDTPGQASVDKWARFLLLFMLHGGNGRLLPRGKYQSSPHIPLALQLMKSFVGTYLPTYDAFIVEAAQETVAYANRAQPAFHNPMPAAKVLGTGAHWLNAQDLASSNVYTTTPSRKSLILGIHKDTGRVVYYPHNESLVTIGGSGSGKSQAHVITNLLNYPGSAFILDVKGELWEKTAGYRQKHFGPCYRFSPTDPKANTHAYNPFDFISQNPDDAAHECAVLAHQLVGEPTGDNKYWANRARDFIWAFAMMVALNHSKQTRNLTYLARYLALPTNFDDINGKEYKASETGQVMQAMRAMGTKTGIADLQAVPNTFESSIQDNARIESVMDTARQFTSAFARSIITSATLAYSDWKPADLRNRTGTSVYISLRPGDLEPFAPVLRLIFQQHARELIAKQAAPDAPPVTFFLDEMPQLGAMPSLTDLLDLGRSAGIRIWLFGQYFGQFDKAYKKLAKGLISGCRVACWMKPDDDAMGFIKPALGTTHSYFSNDRRPLAAEDQLRGREFADDIIAISPGETPMRLSKLMAFTHMADRMAHPTPPVPRVKIPIKVKMQSAQP